MKNMRMSSVCFVLVLSLAGSASAALNDGLAAYYSFDNCDVAGVIADESGNGNNALLVASTNSLNTNPAPICVPGVKGKAYRLWGASACSSFYCGWGYINVPNSPSLSFLDNFTISLWFNIQDYLSMNGYGAFTETDGMHSLMAKAGDRNGLIMRTVRDVPPLLTDGLMRVLVFDGQFGGSNAFGDYTKKGFGLNEWHMITFTSGPLASGNVNVYFDGELQFTWPATLFNVNTSMQYMPLQLGIDQDAVWYPLNGMLDDVRVYNRELGAAEVQQLYTTIINTPPVAVCKNVTVPAQSGLCSAPASIDGGSYDPDGDAITLVQNPVGPYPLGVTPVVLTVTDAKGASASCTAAVTVVDRQPPVVQSFIASPNLLWPPDHRLVPVTVKVSAADNCDPNSSCRITAVSSNEPVNGLGDGDTDTDWIITGGLTADLRAERSGTGSGRVYTINAQCTDASGNSAAATASVTVPHNQ